MLEKRINVTPQRDQKNSADMQMIVQMIFLSIVWHFNRISMYALIPEKRKSAGTICLGDSTC